MDIQLTWQPYDAVAEAGAPEGTESAMAETDDLVFLAGSIPPLKFGKLAIAVKTPGTDYDKVGIFEDNVGIMMDLDAVKAVAQEMATVLKDEEIAEIVVKVREDAAAGLIGTRGDEDEVQDEDEPPGEATG